MVQMLKGSSDKLKNAHRHLRKREQANHVQREYDAALENAMHRQFHHHVNQYNNFLSGNSGANMNAMERRGTRLLQHRGLPLLNHEAYQQEIRRELERRTKKKPAKKSVVKKIQGWAMAATRPKNRWR